MPYNKSVYFSFGKTVLRYLSIYQPTFFWCFAGYVLLLWTKYLVLWLLILNEKFFSLFHTKNEDIFEMSLSIYVLGYRVEPKGISGQRDDRDLGRFTKIKGKTRLDLITPKR